MKKLILSIYFFLFVIALSSQFSVKILNENFNSNMMRWQIHQNENSEMNIHDGKYTISSLKEGTAVTSTIETPNIQDENYSITASIMKLKGIEDNGYGIVWGSLDANNEFEFVISGNGQFKVSQWEQGNKTELLPWTYSSKINKWDFATNILNITCKNQIWRFYINENYVAAVKERATFGIRTGFVLNENIQMESDYIIVENLTVKEEKLEENNDIEIVKLEYQGQGFSNELKYNESAIVNLQIKNNGKVPVKDLIIRTQFDGEIYGVEYSPITMIDKINPYEIATISIKLEADEEVLTQNLNMNIFLENLNNEKIDSENLLIKTIGIKRSNEPEVVENNHDPIENNTNNPVINDNSSNNRTGDGCSKGCTTFGVIGLIVSVILAII